MATWPLPRLVFLPSIPVRLLSPANEAEVGSNPTPPRDIEKKEVTKQEGERTWFRISKNSRR